MNLNYETNFGILGNQCIYIYLETYVPISLYYTDEINNFYNCVQNWTY